MLENHVLGLVRWVGFGRWVHLQNIGTWPKQNRAKERRQRRKEGRKEGRKDWALVSEPGFLKFQIFRFSILEIFVFLETIFGKSVGEISRNK